MLADIASAGMFVGQNVDGQKVLQNITTDSLRLVCHNFLQPVPINVNHNKNDVVGLVDQIRMFGNNLVGQLDIDASYKPSSQVYASPEFLLDDNNQPTKLLAVGIVSQPAITTNRPINVQ